MKICVNHLKTRLDQQLPTSGMTALEASHPREPSSESVSDASLDDAGNHIDNGHEGGDVSLAALTASTTGALLTVKAESDLNLYGNIVSDAGSDC
jgi:hypothetical protein